MVPDGPLSFFEFGCLDVQYFQSLSVATDSASHEHNCWLIDADPAFGIFVFNVLLRYEMTHILAQIVDLIANLVSFVQIP